MMGTDSGLLSDSDRGFIKKWDGRRRRVAATVVAAAVAVVLWLMLDPINLAIKGFRIHLGFHGVDLQSLSNREDLHGWSQNLVEYLYHPRLPSNRRADTQASKFRKSHVAQEQSKTRVLTSGEELQNPGGCFQRGPFLIKRATPRTMDAILQDELAPRNETLAQKIKSHVSLHAAEVLSLKDHRLCSWDPQIFLPSLHIFNEPEVLTLKKTVAVDRFMEIASAYVFFDVCFTFNTQSKKEVQRGLIYFDPSNRNKFRCVPCPNPQTNVEWFSNKCGMMWLHQINARSFNDFVDCYLRNEELIDATGQTQIPGSSRYSAPRGSIYYQKRTLHLQYVKNNPGHQLWDTLFSILTIVRAEEVHKVRLFDAVFSQETSDCPPNVWICEILRKIGVIQEEITDDGEHILRPFIGSFDEVLPCFREVIVPVQGWNHMNEFSSRNFVQWARIKLSSSFGLVERPRAPKDIVEIANFVLSHGKGKRPKFPIKMVVYTHHTIGEAGKRRAWLTLQQDVKSFRKRLETLEVEVVEDFAKLSVAKQARLFHEADILLMPHGGQFGNIMFARAHSIVIEVNCNGYSHIGLRANQHSLAASLDIFHVVLVPCGCTSRTDEGNFRVNYDELAKAFNAVKRIATKNEDDFSGVTRTVKCD